MSKTLFKVVSLSTATLVLSGCSLFLTDHTDDYQDQVSNSSALIVPEGAVPSRDVLVIPNEDKIASLTPSKPFTIPRAPFVFYPMVEVTVNETEEAFSLVVPTGVENAKRIVADYLTSLYGAGTPIASQTENTLTSVPFDFHPQGWLSSVWSSVTRIYPKQTAFSFEFDTVNEQTVIKVTYREEQEGSEPTGWMTPNKNEDAYAVAVRLWGVIGRQLNQSSAFLSNRESVSDFPVWVDHEGMYAIQLGKDPVSETSLLSTFESANLYLMPDKTQFVSPVPADQVARIGDVIDLSIPLGNGQKQKLFNVYRRNLNDVTWDEREYPYEITKQKAGYFLVIDVSAAPNPEVVSFRLAQRFIN